MDKTNCPSKLVFQKIIALILFTGIIFSCQKHNPQKASSKKQDSTTPVHIPKKSKKSSQLVIPGKQMGNFSIDENANHFLDTLPKPDFQDAAMGKVLLKWNQYRGDTLFIFAAQKMGIEDFKRIKMIRSFSPYFRTQEDLGIGSHLSEIESHIPLKKKGTYIESEKHYTLYLASRGIGFETDAKNNCRAIVIFAKDYLPERSYLPFYPKFKEYQPDSPSSH